MAQEANGRKAKVKLEQTIVPESLSHHKRRVKMCAKHVREHYRVLERRRTLGRLWYFEAVCRRKST